MKSIYYVNGVLTRANSKEEALEDVKAIQFIIAEERKDSVLLSIHNEEQRQMSIVCG